ncbi:MAG: hypothetical protein F4122_01480 [Gammaproteobacteria bacterium]|nr:hypothetical protein [Gammaproteobacteria bacterium]
MNIKLGMVLLTGSLVLLAGCAGTNTGMGIEREYVFDPALYDRAIDQTSDRFPEIDPLYLSDEIKLYVEDRVGTDLRSDKYLATVLQELLYDENRLNIRYSDEKTYTAAEVFHARRGNCLSVMNLYVAMARHVGLDASFQTIKEVPAWNRRSDLLVLSQHINATGRIGPREYYVADFTPQIALQRNTEDVISDEAARALYFNNLGAEAMFAGDMEQGLAYIKNALFIDPGNSEAWTNLGAAFMRLEDGAMAEFSFHYALETDDSNVNAMNNLAKFYRVHGEDERASRFERAAERFNQRNPYFHFDGGLNAYAESDYESARKLFERAINLHPFEADFHLALERAYIGLGEPRSAREARQAAETVLAASENSAEVRAYKLRFFERRFNRIDRRSILRPSSPGTSFVSGNGTHPIAPFWW